MTLRNLDDKPLRNQTVAELRTTLNQDYRKAEDLLKSIELELVGRREYDEEEFQGLFLPAFNEFRYASRHIVGYLTPDEQEKGADELIDSIYHCRRAQRDLQDCLFAFFLDMCRRILNNSRRKKLSKAYPSKEEFEADCQELNRIARANLTNVINDNSDEFVSDNESSVVAEGCDTLGKGVKSANKDLDKLIAIYDRFEAAFFS